MQWKFSEIFRKNMKFSGQIFRLTSLVGLVSSGVQGVHSFIPDIYIAPLQENLLRGALSPATVKEKCLEKLAERRHVPRQQAQCKRELIPSGWANNRERSTLFKRRAGPNQELTTSRTTKASAANHN